MTWRLWLQAIAVGIGLAVSGIAVYLASLPVVGRYRRRGAYSVAMLLTTLADGEALILWLWLRALLPSRHRQRVHVAV